MHKKISDFFYRNLKINPDKKFIYSENKSLSYKESSKRINSVLKILNNIKCKNIICITKSEFTFFNTLIAASELNIAFSPLSNLIKPLFLQNIITQYQFDCLIIDKNVFENIDIETKKLIQRKILNIILIKNDKISIFKTSISNKKKNNYFLMCFTSGSTGAPKSILLSQNSKILRAKCVIDLYNLDQNDKILITTPLYHTLAFRKLIINIILNSECYIKTGFDPNYIRNIIKKNKISFTMMVPSQLDKIFKKKNIKEKIILRNLVSSSSTLSLKLKKRVLNNINGNFHECFGSSETSIISNINYSKDIKNLNTLGKQIKNVIIKINSKGELLCKSPLMFSGYLNKNKINKHLKNNFFNTGDIISVNKKKYLTFKSRSKEIMKIGSISVYPKDIEKVLLNNQFIANCLVFSIKDKSLEDKIVALIQKRPRSTLTKRDILHYCHDKIENYQIPNIIKFIKKIPSNSMGKINIISLKKKLFDQ